MREQFLLLGGVQATARHRVHEYAKVVPQRFGCGRDERLMQSHRRDKHIVAQPLRLTVKPGRDAMPLDVGALKETLIDEIQRLFAGEPR